MDAIEGPTLATQYMYSFMVTRAFKGNIKNTWILKTKNKNHPIFQDHAGLQPPRLARHAELWGELL